MRHEAASLSEAAHRTIPLFFLLHRSAITPVQIGKTNISVGCLALQAKPVDPPRQGLESRSG